MKKYLLEGANFNLSSPGVPLSYTLKFVKDNSVAKLVNYDKFTIRECTIVPPASSTTTIKATIDEVKLNHISGDKEFSGWAKVTLKVSLYRYNKNRELWARVYIKMKEPGGDGTTGERTLEKKIWTAPSGMQIQQFLTSPTSQIYTYTDNDVNYDEVFFPVRNNLISYAKFLGDTDGDDLTLSDIESTGHLHRLTFNPIQVRLVRQ